eukprot:jgi/Psemu1/26622/gm1.26622_g
MDEFQFIESLDALLASEAMDDATADAVELENLSSNGPMISSMNALAANPTPLQGQGLLLGTTGQGTIARSNANCNWLRGNDDNNNHNSMNTNRNSCIEDCFAMPLLSAPTLAKISTAPSIAPAQCYQHCTSTSTYMNQSPAGPASLVRMNTNPTGISASASICTNTSDNAMKAVAGAMLPSAVPMDPATSLSATMRASVATTSPNVQTQAPSEATSVCSANSLGSSHASFPHRRSGSNGANDNASKSLSRKRSRNSTAVSESEDDSSRRRHDRNLREQRRSQKITHQIDELREVLAAASVRFKPDKFSTLVSVVDYVKQLQTRSSMLDAEHKKLLDTITKTNEMVNEPYLGNSGASASSAMGSGGNGNGAMGTGTDAAQPDATLSGDGSTSGNGNPNGVAGGPNDIYNDDELVFVRNVDYKCIFDKCGMPLAVASIDGRLIDCNEEFVNITGYRREELLPVEQEQQKQQQQQGSVTIADEVGSSCMSSAVYPDALASNSDGTKSSSITVQQQDPNGHNGSNTSSAKRASNTTTVRNFSLFNLLSRNHMEEVFVSLSAMLKHPLKEESGKGFVASTDFWSGNVRLSRNSHLEVGHAIPCYVTLCILCGLSFFNMDSMIEPY